MKCSLFALFVLVLMLVFSSTNLALATTNYGTKEEAQALAEKAATFYKEKGELALKDFQNKEGEFIDRDLYIFIVDKKGTFKAHGGNASLIGKNALSLKDVTGFEIIKAFIEAPSGSWVDYKWTSPTERGKLKNKSSYIIKVGDDLVGVGCYSD